MTASGREPIVAIDRFRPKAEPEHGEKSVRSVRFDIRRRTANADQENVKEAFRYQPIGSLPLNAPRTSSSLRSVAFCASVNGRPNERAFRLRTTVNANTPPSRRSSRLLARA
jgi:hypothetical protein